MERLESRLAILFVVVVALACGDAESPLATVESRTEAALRANLTAAAAAALSPAGMFNELVRNPAPGAPTEISLDRAKVIATAWATQYAPLRKSFYDSRRGAPTDWGALSVCDRPFYAATPFEPPAVNVPLSVRRAFGPWWLLTLCGPGGDPQLSVAVSAWATDLEIKNGANRHDDRPNPLPSVLLGGPSRSGVYLVPLAIPVGGPPIEAFLMTPERAVEMVVVLTGGTVTEAPELIKMPDVVPQLGSWRVRLERTAPVRDLETGAIAEASEFFVTFHAPHGLAGQGMAGGTRVMIADSDQPASRSFRYLPTEALFERSRDDESSVSDEIGWRPSYPSRLRPVGPVSDAAAGESEES